MNSLTVVFNALPAILAGSFVTIGNVTASLAMGLVLGVPLAVSQVYGGPWLRRLVALYVWFFRGVPILVLLFLCYGLFISLGLPADPFLICCLVLGCTSTAYQSQIFRGAIESLPQGQLKAARALGMNDFTGIRCIVLPQACACPSPAGPTNFPFCSRTRPSATSWALRTLWPAPPLWPRAPTSIWRSTPRRV